MREREIEIRRLWCKGCGFCVATCTRGVLRMDGSRPVVENSERCTGCERCVWICPDFAIKITEDTKVARSVAED